MRDTKQSIPNPMVIPGLPSKVKITSDIITEVVCRELEIDPAVLSTRSRESRPSRARFCIWYIARKLNHNGQSDRRTFKSLGLMFKRDHATALSGIKTLQFEIDTYKPVAETMRRLEMAVITEAVKRQNEKEGRG